MKITSEIAELLGAFAGDGWLAKSGEGLYILGNPTEDKEYYDSFLGPLFSKNFSSIKPKLFQDWGVYGIACYKKDPIRLALKYGFISGAKAKTIRAPKSIRQSHNRRIICAFLRGLFDTDGSFYCERARSKTSNPWRKKYHHQPRIDFHLASRNLVYDIQKLCDKLGFKSAKIITIKGKHANNRNNSTSYKFRINRKHYVQLWFSKIGSSNLKQKTRYAVWNKCGFLPPKTYLKDRLLILGNKLDPHTFYT